MSHKILAQNLLKSVVGVEDSLPDNAKELLQVGEKETRKLKVPKSRSSGFQNVFKMLTLHRTLDVLAATFTQDTSAPQVPKIPKLPNIQRLRTQVSAKVSKLLWKMAHFLFSPIL